MLFGEGPQIKNIAADLNKLFRQGSLLNQSGQTVEGDSTADQGTSDLLAARDPVIQEISVGMSGEPSARYTVSGTPPLSLPNSLGKPLKAWEVDVVPYQEGTGDPSPTNVRPIHGTDKIGLYVGSPNVWDEEWELGLYSSSTGNPIASNSAIRSKDTNYIPVVAGSTYYFVTAGKVMEVYQYKADKTFISKFNVTNNSATVDAECSYLRFDIGASYGTTYNHDIAINYPATVTTYNPHQGGITTITLPQTVYTGTIGSDGGESRWGEVDLGALNWLPNGNNAIYGAIPNKKVGSQNALCEALAQVSASTSPPDMPNASFKCYDSNANIAIKLTGIDPTTAPTMLAGYKFVYELATPTTFAVTAPSIPTSNGNATIWAVAEDGLVDSMEVTYIGKA